MDVVATRNIILKLNEWRRAGINCDVSLIIGTQKFHAHKNILAAASEFFEKLFTGDFAEKEKSAITLEDVDPDGFRLFLDYIYTGEIKIDDDNFEQVLSVVSYYQIECVMEMLFDYVKSNISTDNGFYYYCLVDSVGMKKLKQFTKEFIRNDFLTCSNCAAFLDVTYAVLLEFIDSPIKDELDRFKIITKWIQNDSNERSNYLSHLIEYVCFEYINSDAMLNEILDHQLVINNLEIIKAIQQRRTMQGKMCIYGMNGSDLIKVDILNSKLEATYMVAKTKLDYDEFQIISAASAVYISTFKLNEGNKLYRFEDSQWVLLNRNYDADEPNLSIVYSEKHKTIYENNECKIFSYNLDTKSSVVEYTNNPEDHEICGSLVFYNDFLYTVLYARDGFYTLQYDPLNKKAVLRSKLSMCLSETQSAVLGDKMFIVSGGLVQMYDITNDQCTIIVENNENIRSIFYHSLITYRNRLYAIRKKWDVIDVFDPSKMDWTDEIHLKIKNKNIFDIKMMGYYSFF